MFSLQTTKLRLILSWGEKPSDLDAYLVSFNESCQVYYGQKTGENCNGHDVELNTDNTAVSKIL